MRSLRISNIKEARRKARKLAESLNDDTHSREEEVRGSKHVTFRQAVDHYMEGCIGTEKSIYETRLRLNFICGDLDGQRRYPREAWGNRRIQTIKTKDIENWMRYEKKPGHSKDSTEHQYLNAITGGFVRHATTKAVEKSRDVALGTNQLAIWRDWMSSAMAKRYARVNPTHLQKHADRLEELPGYLSKDHETQPPNS